MKSVHGRISCSGNGMYDPVPQPLVTQFTAAHRGIYTSAAGNGSYQVSVRHSSNTAPSLGSTDAVLDLRQCTLSILGRTIRLSPIECALCWWIVQAGRPIPWGKSLRDEDCAEFCTRYQTICQQRHLKRIGGYSTRTPFEERLSVLLKAVSTINPKLSEQVGQEAALRYAPQPDGHYAEKEHRIRAAVIVRE